MPPIASPDGYDGEINVYESSAAFQPGIWLRTEDADGMVIVLLTLERVQQLEDQLRWLRENHWTGN